ncbi:hypothetical protein R3P38DRAFT_2843163 [Favolaschia claudopus]|uniref:Uncharacterized protein n=1 Tax=Favolaschia claudopus TaxID=2862362 RepID=A0AAW0E1T9_9AGAR
MLDHYYTPRDLPDLDLTGDPLSSNPILTDLVTAKPRATACSSRPAVVDLSAIALEQLVAFDCDDSDSESGSDDGYVSTLLRIQRAAAPVALPRKIAGARRVARAVSAPHTPRVTETGGAGSAGGMDVDSEMGDLATKKNGANVTEGELFQSITATPGLESTSFEELRLETYLQSLVATGTARPQPAFAPPLVIPPAFAAQFIEHDDDNHSDNGDVDMPHVNVNIQQQQSLKTRDPRKRLMQPAPPLTVRAASFPPSAAQQWGRE